MNGVDLNQPQQPQEPPQQPQQQQKMQIQMQMQHQQWLAMQHYQQWMAMQQHMMYNQQFVPYYQHPYHQKQSSTSTNNNINQIQGTSEDNKTIWIGDLQQWMDEGYLHSCFSQTGEIVSVKIIRNRQTGHSERYGFIEFNSHAVAEKALQNFNGTMMPNGDQPFRLNWAAFGGGDKERRPDTGVLDLSIFVGDLATDVTDELLHETFSGKYPSVKSAKVVVDANSGRSKGYGFVRFGDENERSQAIAEMNGAYCSSRPMRVGVATPKKQGSQQQFSTQGGYGNGVVPQGQFENDASNTTIFVGGLDADVTDEELRQSFIPFGEVLSVKIPFGKGCGFVQLANRTNAEDAIERLNGTVIGKQTVRLSWGRNMGNRQWRGDGGSRNGYYGRQGGYGNWYANSPSPNDHQQQPVS